MKNSDHSVGAQNPTNSDDSNQDQLPAPVESGTVHPSAEPSTGVVSVSSETLSLVELPTSIAANLGTQSGVVQPQSSDLQTQPSVARSYAGVSQTQPDDLRTHQANQRGQSANRSNTYNINNRHDSYQNNNVRNGWRTQGRNINASRNYGRRNGPPKRRDSYRRDSGNSSGRNFPIRGTATNMSFRGAPLPKALLFLYRVGSETLESEVSDHLTSNGLSDCEVQQGLMLIPYYTLLWCPTTQSPSIPIYI